MSDNIPTADTEVDRLAKSIAADPNFKGSTLDAYAAAQVALYDFTRQQTRKVPVHRQDP